LCGNEEVLCNSEAGRLDFKTNDQGAQVGTGEKYEPGHFLVSICPEVSKKEFSIFSEITTMEPIKAVPVDMQENWIRRKRHTKKKSPQLREV